MNAAERAAAALANAGHEDAAREVAESPAEGPTLAELDLDAALVAAAPLAESLGLDREPIAAGVDFARADLDDGDEGSDFVTFVWDFVQEPERRGIVYQRLSERVQRRRMREEDVEGLF
ncbi:MAG: hypothetical protein ABEJ68_09985 [Halobacteriaceae archaeon]